MKLDLTDCVVSLDAPNNPVCPMYENIIVIAFIDIAPYNPVHLVVREIRYMFFFLLFDIPF